MRNDLRLIPFFSDLSDDVLSAIEKYCRREHYTRGELVFAEGDYGDRMYILQSGQVKVVSQQNGSEKIFSYLNPGNFFGETALLTDEPRHSSVRVVIDSDLISLGRQELHELIEQYPTIAVELSRELSRRLTRQLQAPLQQEELNIVAVVGQEVVSLAEQVAALTGEDVFLFDLGGLGSLPVDQRALSQHGVQLARGGQNLTADDLPARLSALMQEYYWVILAIPLRPSLLTIKAIDLADVTIQLADAPERWLTQAATRAFRVVQPAPKWIARLARKIARRQVGLALSSGGARGLAHIGVLQVLEREGIPIDLIAASSMGSLVGALYAAGLPLGEIVKVAQLMQRQTNPLTGFSMWDIGVPPRAGLIRGNKTLDYLRKVLHDKKFEDLETPLSIVTCDVITGEEVLFDSGPVADAVRASISIIGVFEPAHIGEHFLVDGGTVNPVPTSVLKDKHADIVIASNVIPGLPERMHRKEQLKTGKAPNVISIVLGAIEIMESEIIKSRSDAIDILIAPDVAQFSSLDYDRVNDIIQVGQDAAERALPQIRQLLAPRPRVKAFAV
ncbi:MAG TPA: patatin-like phospholipase family protein [Anaerolineae bacterium]|nr:patatin-like phospholipase family protein [Anaerolineae bacterium]